jgi:hypothetical protein
MKVPMEGTIMQGHFNTGGKDLRLSYGPHVEHSSGMQTAIPPDVETIVEQGSKYVVFRRVKLSRGHKPSAVVGVEGED